MKWLVGLGISLCLISAPAALGDMVAGPNATKICVGPNGGGFSWGIELNEGWQPSRKLHYRLTLLTPGGVRIGFYDQTTGGYYEHGVIDQQFIDDTNGWYKPTLPGTYTMILETKVDAGYPQVNLRRPPSVPGKWEKWSPWKVKAYVCR